MSQNLPNLLPRLPGNEEHQDVKEREQHDGQNHDQEQEHRAPPDHEPNLHGSEIATRFQYNLHILEIPLIVLDVKRSRCVPFSSELLKHEFFAEFSGYEPDVAGLLVKRELAEV